MHANIPAPAKIRGWDDTPVFIPTAAKVRPAIVAEPTFGHRAIKEWSFFFEGDLDGMIPADGMYPTDAGQRGIFLRTYFAVTGNVSTSEAAQSDLDRDLELWHEEPATDAWFDKSELSDVILQLLAAMSPQDAREALPGLSKAYNAAARAKNDAVTDVLSLVIRKVRNIMMRPERADKDLIESAKKETRQTWITGAIEDDGRWFRILGKRTV